MNGGWWRSKEFHHCFSASLCTWRSPAPPHLPTPRWASTPETLRHSRLSASPFPLSASRCSQSVRSPAPAPPNTSSALLLTTCLHAEFKKTCTLILVTPVLRLFCRKAGKYPCCPETTSSLTWMLTKNCLSLNIVWTLWWNGLYKRPFLCPLVNPLKHNKMSFEIILVTLQTNYTIMRRRSLV